MSQWGDRPQGNRQRTHTHSYTLVHTFTDRCECGNNPREPFCLLVTSTSWQSEAKGRDPCWQPTAAPLILTLKHKSAARALSFFFVENPPLCGILTTADHSLISPECRLCHKTPEAKRPGQPLTDRHTHTHTHTHTLKHTARGYRSVVTVVSCYSCDAGRERG